MARWFYHYAGLRVASALELPEWRAFEVEPPDAATWQQEIEIRLEDAPAEEHPPLHSAAEVRFRVQGIADYWVERGEVIRIAPHPQAGAREVRLFLLGSAWGALCYQRGVLALHASVVEVEGQALAFCGVSGAGKSSVAGWLVAQGHRLIGDDLCHFDMQGTTPRVYPAAPRLKLWREALDELGWQSATLERDHFRMEKFHTMPDESHARKGTTPIPLRAIFLLAWGESRLVRLTGLASVYQFVESATYRGEMLEPMGALAAHWQRCADVARHVPIYQFTRPKAWSTMPAVMQNLLQSQINTWQTEGIAPL